MAANHQMTNKETIPQNNPGQEVALVLPQTKPLVAIRSNQEVSKEVKKEVNLKKVKVGLKGQSLEVQDQGNQEERVDQSHLEDHEVGALEDPIGLGLTQGEETDVTGEEVDQDLTGGGTVEVGIEDVVANEGATVEVEVIVGEEATAVNLLVNSGMIGKEDRLVRSEVKILESSLAV